MTRLIDKKRVLPDEADKLQKCIIIFHSNESSSINARYIEMNMKIILFTREISRLKESRKDNRQTPFPKWNFVLSKASRALELKG